MTVKWSANVQFKVIQILAHVAHSVSMSSLNGCVNYPRIELNTFAKPSISSVVNKRKSMVLQWSFLWPGDFGWCYGMITSQPWIISAQWSWWCLRWIILCGDMQANLNQVNMGEERTVADGWIWSPWSGKETEKDKRFYLDPVWWRPFIHFRCGRSDWT